MVTGRTPFSGKGVKDLLLQHLKEPVPDPAALVEGLPPLVSALTARLLEKNRDLRPANARQLILAIEEAQRGLRLPAGAPTPAPRPALRPRIPRRVLIAASLVLGGALALAGGTALTVRLVRRHGEEKALLAQVEAIWPEAMGRTGDPDPGRLLRLRGELEALRVHPAAIGSSALLASIEERLARADEAIQEARENAAHREKEAAAAKDLEGLLAGMPASGAIRGPKELDAAVAPLSAFAKERSGTEAAQEAASVAARIRRETEVRFRKAEDALRSHRIPADTFLASTPPRYREALESLRAAPEEIRGTPAEDLLNARIAEVRDAMLREARDWAAAAEKDAAAGRPVEAAAALERLRARLEGEALEVLEKAIRPDPRRRGGAAGIGPMRKDERPAECLCAVPALQREAFRRPPRRLRAARGYNEKA